MNSTTTPGSPLWSVEVGLQPESLTNYAIPGNISKPGDVFLIASSFSSALQNVSQLLQVLLAHCHWSWVFLPFLFWEVRRMVWTLFWKAPRNVRIIGYPTIFGKYVTAICMVFDSDRILQKAYDTSGGQPFAIPMLDRYVVFVSDREEAARLEHNTPSNLSEIEALHELASTDHVLRDVKISSERYFKDGTGALKKHLRSNLPAMSRDIQNRVRVALDDAFNKAPVVYLEGNCSEEQQWKRIDVVPVLLRMITRINVPIFVGDDAVGDTDEVLDNLMKFFWSCLMTLVLITFVPSYMIASVVPILMGWGVSKWKLFDTLLTLSRSSVSTEGPSEPHKPVHLVQWVADMMKVPDAVEVAKTSLGLVFGSAFQIPMLTQATIYHLCQFPEYIPTLLSEVTSQEFEPFKSTNRDLPHLDSFIKETARLNPGLILSVPRRVMSTYTSTDNIIIPEGNWMAVPQYTLMRDPEIWSEGRSFHGFRFVNAEGQSTSRFTHPSHEFPYWGSIRHACPARFYAAMLVKTIITRLLCHYEFRLEKPDARLFYSFGLIRLTNPFMTLLIRARKH